MLLYLSLVEVTNEGVSEGVNIPTESVKGVNIPQGSEFETESAQAGLEAQPPLPNVCPNFDENIPIFRGYSEAFKSLKAGSAGNSLSLKKLKSHYAYKLEKVLSDGTAAAAKKKKGLTARSVARAYMLYVIGSFLFPTKKGIDVSARYLIQFAKDKKWDVSVTDRYGGTALLNFREALDNYKLEDVVWDPYRDKRDSPHAFKEVNFFYGTLASPDHVQPYYPNRVVRQFNREQSIPTKRLLTEASDLWNAKVAKKFSPKGRRVREGPLVCTEAYLEWFASVSWTTICPITVDLAANDYGIHQRKPVSVNKHGDTPVHQSEDIAEQYDASDHEQSSRSPNINLNDQQITTLNDQLQKLKEDKEESEANINLREALKEKTSECNLLKETIEQMKAEIELKYIVDEQCALEFADLPRQLDAKVRYWSAKIWKKKNTSLEAELRQKSGLEDCNQSLSVELNKKCKKIESLKAVNALLMKQIDLQLPPARPLVVLQSHQLVPNTTLAKKYEDLLAAHEDIKKKLIVKEDFRQKLVNAEEMMKSLEANNIEWEVWRQTLKKELASEGMGDMGDPTFEELF
ncbi:hypothetical protein GIB67_010345 [Kingdonia uniflora]|uniref:Aminotransferase-like plant mobile domain-containing protein n=1 Tax=Kingdonia uniflora TaxID=39325 RepID=A0A7J7MA49_9MAGN|nr:hypothetical protein GIB67_010345 [Kingdonia uniflora]